MLSAMIPLAMIIAGTSGMVGIAEIAGTIVVTYSNVAIPSI